MLRHLRGVTVVATLIAASSMGSAAVAATTDVAPPGRTIGFVLTSKIWVTFNDADKADCPQGMNDGPREEFASLYPDDGKKRTLLDTRLERERAIWHPSTTPEKFTFKEPVGKIAAGLNLDGKIKAADFTSPDGEPGIDNQMFRVLGCVANYRPGGTRYNQFNVWNERFDFNRVVIELTNVDSLTNDDDVDVAIYKGLDRMLLSSAGAGYVAGGTQRIDTRHGRFFERHMKGRIKDGVLTTDPVDARLPETSPQQDVTYFDVRALRFKLKLTPWTAEGLWGGYTVVDNFYYQTIKQWSTSQLAYGQEAAPSVYRALHRLADAYPDPKTGENTAISSAMQVKFIQVFVEHPKTEPSAKRVADAGSQ
jgi:uncharacterized membrane protein